jgi:carboxyl-terminal processing protease
VLVMKETDTRSALISNKMTSQKIGYVNLPSFYHDFKKNGRTSAGDLRNEIAKLKTDKVNGLILDLRDNGGGYVKDSVDIAGFFIKTGPVLQVRNRSGQREIYDDQDASILYNGPMVVLINSLSASAAEILAAALQDYQRAVIIGGPGSFGKGTIQSMIDLDQLLSSNYQSYKPLGSLKVTDNKFYRINGSSTQQKGVTADIPLPDFYQYLDTGERTLKHALPWDTVAPLAYQKYVNPKRWEFTALRARSQSRVQASAGFKQINQNILQVKKRQESTLQTLKLAQFLTEQDQLQREMEQAQKNQIAPSYLRVTSNSADLKVKRDALLRKQFDEWYRGLHRDPYLEEATFILRDMLL